MYTIIQETNGKEVEYSVIDNRTYKTMYTCTTKEEAVKYIQKKEYELYMGSGVIGNTI